MKIIFLGWLIGVGTAEIIVYLAHANSAEAVFIGFIGGFVGTTIGMRMAA